MILAAALCRWKKGHNQSVWGYSSELYIAAPWLARWWSTTCLCLWVLLQCTGNMEDLWVSDTVDPLLWVATCEVPRLNWIIFFREREILNKVNEVMELLTQSCIKLQSEWWWVLCLFPLHDMHVSLPMWPLCIITQGCLLHFLVACHESNKHLWWSLWLSDSKSLSEMHCKPGYLK